MIAVLDEEIVMLERMFEEDDIKCEFNHINTLCSSEVTHILTWCEGSKFICKVATQAALKKRNEYGCARCLRDAKDCWTIRPI